MIESPIINNANFEEEIQYKVKNEIVLLVGKTSEVARVEYILSIKIINEKKKIIVNRKNFKVDGAEVSNKFPYISLKYMDSIFPLIFDINKNSLLLSNADEIKKNIDKVDKELQIEYQGKGFTYIRDEFLDKTNTKNKIINFVRDINFIRIIELTLFDNQNQESLDFIWYMPPFLTEANFLLLSETEQNISYGEIKNKTQIIESINTCSENYNLNFKLNAVPDFFHCEFNQEIDEFKADFKFTTLKANFSLAVDYNFSYTEKITFEIIY